MLQQLCYCDIVRSIEFSRGDVVRFTCRETGGIVTASSNLSVSVSCLFVLFYKYYDGAYVCIKTEWRTRSTAAKVTSSVRDVSFDEIHPRTEIFIDMKQLLIASSS